MDNFIERLEFLLDNFEYSASSFADKIGVQRSSLSHLLSGRNKPSLDFILKIDQAFPELSLTWLLKGDGYFLQNSESPISKITPNSCENSLQENKANEVEISQVKKQKKTKNKSDDPIENASKKHDSSNSIALKNFPLTDNIQQIVVFYTDGSFKSFEPR